MKKVLWILGISAALIPLPAVAQTVVQHCQMVTTCETTEVSIFGITISEDTVCRKDVICHYHVQ